MTGNLIVDFLWNAIIAAGVMACLAMAGRIWLAFPDRTIDDVVDFLRHIDLERAEMLLDPAVEWSLRGFLNIAEFRKLQRKRIHLYRDFLQRMAHNAAILVQWGNLEAHNGDEERARLAHELQQEAVKVRVYSVLTLLKLQCWLLISFDSWTVIPAPSLSDAREIFGIQGLESYDHLKAAANNLFLRVGHARLQELSLNL